MDCIAHTIFEIWQFSRGTRHLVVDQHETLHNSQFKLLSQFFSLQLVHLFALEIVLAVVVGDVAGSASVSLWIVDAQSADLAG